MINQRARLILFSVAALGCLVASGCDASSDTATITGTVVTNGAPVPEGRVVFSSETGTCAGEIIDGEYELKNRGSSNIPLGEYTITVFPPPNREVYNESTGQEDLVASGVDPALFPRKYQNKDSSDIKFFPEAGKNNFDIVLEK